MKIIWQFLSFQSTNKYKLIFLDQHFNDDTKVYLLFIFSCHTLSDFNIWEGNIMRINHLTKVCDGLLLCALWYNIFATETVPLNHNPGKDYTANLKYKLKVLPFSYPTLLFDICKWLVFILHMQEVFLLCNISCLVYASGLSLTHHLLFNICNWLVCYTALFSIGLYVFNIVCAARMAKCRIALVS